MRVRADVFFDEIQNLVEPTERSAKGEQHCGDCPAESGALRVVPKSHLEVRIDRARAEALRLEHGETVVPVGWGGVLVMRPLILHASSKATSLSQRRVLHFVFGPPSLPLGLEWRWAV